VGSVILKEGDLFTSDAPAIGHGVNTVGVMGSGIAVMFKKHHPGMYDVYREMCQDKDLNPGEIFVWLDEKQRYIYNIASQDNPGSNARLEWLEAGLHEALTDADARGLDRIALPRIGAGIGGLDWESVYLLMQVLVRNYECDIEVWTLPS
jgi:O-acetyl-ADP-ribose deacetylase (regulator of RNase III)